MLSACRTFPREETSMSMKAKSTGKAKLRRKRSTATDLSAKNARSVKGGGHSSPVMLNFSKVAVDYKK
jgi:hypothetical protein